MYPATIVLMGLVTTSTLIGSALMVAWRRFGRERHALFWASAFFVEAIGYCAQFARSGWPASGFTMRLVANGASIAGVALLALGFRRRAGLTRGDGWIVSSALLSALVFAAVPVGDPGGASPRLVPDLFMAAMLAVSALAARLKRADGQPRVRSTAIGWLLLAGAAYCLALAVVALATLSGGRIDGSVYTGLSLLGMPPLLTAVGLATLLLIGGDLAERYHRLAEIDPLTGVLNRRGIDRAAARLIAQARRTGRPLSLVVADLDRFKAINDAHGHQIGDQVLRRFATHAAAQLRGADLLGRLGGEEFVFVLTDSGAGAAAEAMDRLRRGLAGEISDLPVTLPMILTVTASFGIATFGPRGDTLDEMIARADDALYRSKQEGRDRISFAPPWTATDTRFQVAWRRGTPRPTGNPDAPADRRFG